MSEQTFKEVLANIGQTAFGHIGKDWILFTDGFRSFIDINSFSSKLELVSQPPIVVKQPETGFCTNVKIHRWRYYDNLTVNSHEKDSQRVLTRDEILLSFRNSQVCAQEFAEVHEPTCLTLFNYSSFCGLWNDQATYNILMAQYYFEVCTRTPRITYEMLTYMNTTRDFNSSSSSEEP